MRGCQISLTRTGFFRPALGPAERYHLHHLEVFDNDWPRSILRQRQVDRILVTAPSLHHHQRLVILEGPRTYEIIRDVLLSAW